MRLIIKRTWYVKNLPDKLDEVLIENFDDIYYLIIKGKEGISDNAEFYRLAHAKTYYAKNYQSKVKGFDTPVWSLIQEHIKNGKVVKTIKEATKEQLSVIGRVRTSWERKN